MKKSAAAFFIVFLLIFILLVNFSFINVEAGENKPSITAPCAILIDAATGRVLYEKNADQKMYPASTTKIMTGILAVEHGKLDDLLTITNNPQQVEIGSSQIYLIPGERLTMEQLLYALMLESANDAAIAIAEHITGLDKKNADYREVNEAFSALMNKRAKELGAKNTNFVNPNGLHDDNHYTTARDLALIARHGMSLPKFKEVVATLKYTIPATEKQAERNYITNGNKLLWKTYKEYAYEYATGIKTGYTVKAKHCLVSSAKKGNTELIAVVLGAEGRNMYTDSISLFEYGFTNFENVQLLKKGQIVTTVKVRDTEDKINLLAAEDFSVVLNNEEKGKLKTEIKTDDIIKRPIKKGQVLGSMNYFLNGKPLKQISLLASEESLNSEKHFKWWLWLIIAFLIWRTIVTYIKHKRRRRNRPLFKGSKFR